MAGLGSADQGAIEPMMFRKPNTKSGVLLNARAACVLCDKGQYLVDVRCSGVVSV